MVSKPGLYSWACINLGNAYTNCYNYDRNKESHLIKNSEWGAAVYLAHSKYGRDGNNVEINQTSFTGGGSEEIYKEKVNQSSTANITGIFDLCGLRQEMVAEISGEMFMGSGTSVFDKAKDVNGKLFGNDLTNNNIENSKYYSKLSSSGRITVLLWMKQKF